MLSPCDSEINVAPAALFNPDTDVVDGSNVPMIDPSVPSGNDPGPPPVGIVRPVTSNVIPGVTSNTPLTANVLFASSLNPAALFPTVRSPVYVITPGLLRVIRPPVK